MTKIKHMLTYSFEDEKDAEIYARYFVYNNGKGLVILFKG